MASFIISSNRQPGVCLYTVFPIYYMYNKHCNLFLSTGFINPLLLYIFIYLVTQAQIQHSVVVAIKHGPIKITNLPESIHIINQRGNWGGNTELWLFLGQSRNNVGRLKQAQLWIPRPDYLVGHLECHQTCNIRTFDMFHDATSKHTWRSMLLQSSHTSLLLLWFVVFNSVQFNRHI